jgi:hypothetical protein
VDGGRDTGLADPGSPSSPRSRLARAALEAARSLPQVAGGVRGAKGLWATSDAGGVLEGVTAVARVDGRYDVELHLVVQWPLGPLYSLADEVRARARRAAERSGLGDAMGEVSVSFEDLHEQQGSP